MLKKQPCTSKVHIYPWLLDKVYKQEGKGPLQNILLALSLSPPSPPLYSLTPAHSAKIYQDLCCSSRKLYLPTPVESQVWGLYLTLSISLLLKWEKCTISVCMQCSLMGLGGLLFFSILVLFWHYSGLTHLHITSSSAQLWLTPSG